MRILLPNLYIRRLLIALACLMVIGVVTAVPVHRQRDYILAATLLLFVLHVVTGPVFPHCFGDRLESTVPCLRRYVFVDRVIAEDSDDEDDDIEC